jgi:hypothetical protein
MPELIVTRHAMDRYRERVEDVPDGEIVARLKEPVFQRAAEFGAPFVRLPEGQRVVIRGLAVVTVTPAHCPAGVLDPLNDPGAADA